MAELNPAGVTFGAIRLQTNDTALKKFRVRIWIDEIKQLRSVQTRFNMRALRKNVEFVPVEFFPNTIFFIAFGEPAIGVKADVFLRLRPANVHLITAAPSNTGGIAQVNPAVVLS